MARGLLIAAFDFSGAHRDEFHDWYDLEHIPERKTVPGFDLCERWIGDDAPNISVATYDLASIEAIRSHDYQAIAYANSSVWTKRVTSMCTRLLRFDGEQISPGDMSAPTGAGALLMNAMNVAPEGDADFNAWYDEEHLPALAAVPGTLAARRYRARLDDPDRTHEYVAIYHLASADVTRSKAWEKAVDTPWSAKVSPHFRDRIRILSERYVRGA
ncbi:MAG: hypothetical protein CFH10_00416 [Alphaproteobacteria bacterium MarineAlpha4_Bin2]|nr:MAG: hypothetical protein CFH10_00416 [Alphaproteobacteria bacterium MarineAlpha4_Bin2]